MTISSSGPSWGFPENNLKGGIATHVQPYKEMYTVCHSFIFDWFVNCLIIVHEHNKQVKDKSSAQKYTVLYYSLSYMTKDKIILAGRSAKKEYNQKT